VLMIQGTYPAVNIWYVENEGSVVGHNGDRRQDVELSNISTAIDDGSLNWIFCP